MPVAKICSRKVSFEDNFGLEILLLKCLIDVFVPTRNRLLWYV